MPYEYLNHLADLGIRGIGPTLECALSQGACAMLAAMAKVDTVSTVHTYTQHCAAPDIPSLFIEWLNELLYQREIHGALFARARVTKVVKTKRGWTLEGQAFGEPLDPDRHEIHSEVKAATYAGLNYRIEGGQHIVQCILDL